jgi:hypothetical protein
VGQPLRGARHVGRVRVQGQWRVLATEHQVATHARGQVQHHVHVRRTDALHDLAVERHVARALAGGWVAHVDVSDGGPGRSGLYRRVGDLPRGDRHQLAGVRRVAHTGDCTRDEDVGVHGLLLSNRVRPLRA